MHFMTVAFSFLIIIAPVSDAVEFISNNPVNATRRAVLTSGEIIFGGLFPVHTGTKANSTKQCMKLDHERGIHRLEAMLYAIDMINKDSSILSGYNVGVNIRDTCGVDTHALEEAVHFIKGYGGTDGQCRSSATQSTIFGVIGAASSGISIQVANLLRLFKIPQISYASTSPDLNDRQKYDYFLRTVPADTYQARAMIDVVRYFNWSSVHGLYSEGNYGTNGMEMFKELAKASKICVVASIMVNKQTDFNSVIEKIAMFETTRVVVLFLSTDHLSSLLRAVKSKIDSPATEKPAKYKFKWLASDYWGTRSQFITENNVADVAHGAITLTLQTVKVPGFESYFRKLSPAINKRNPWFKTFWEETHKCTLSNQSGISACSGNETLHDGYTLDDKVPYVIDAVYALAYALNYITRKYCPGFDCKLSSFTGKTLLDVLQRNVSFTGELGLLKFDDNGSTIREYEINEFIDEPNGQYRKLGTWIHKLKGMTAKTDVTSSCSEECKRGQLKIPKRDLYDVTCCFRCQDCGPNQFVESKLTSLIFNARLNEI